MNKILVVNVNWIGDTVFVLPFLEALRGAYPDAAISVLTHPRCKDILELSPAVNEIIFYDEKGRNKNLLSRFAVVAQLKSRQFDAAFILRRSLTRTMLLFLSGIPRRIGFVTRKTGFLLTDRVPAPPRRIHRVDYFLSLLMACGQEACKKRYRIFIPQSARKEADALLHSAGIDMKKGFIVLNPGGNWGLKRWPAERFAELGDRIFDVYGKQVVLTGADKDIPLCSYISGRMRHPPALLCGRTGLKVLCALFERSACVVSNDSGPMHLAAGVAAPLVALFGPTSPEITGPYGEGRHKVIHKELDASCRIPCYKLSCSDNRCIKKIEVADVLAAISSLLNPANQDADN